MKNISRFLFPDRSFFLMTMAIVAFFPAVCYATSDTVNAVNDGIVPMVEDGVDTNPPASTDAVSEPDVVVSPPADITTIPAPQGDALDAITNITPLPLESLDEGEAVGGSPMGTTEAVQKHSGQYYDAVSVTPDNELAGTGAIGPRKVDPKYEPGQRFSVVNKSGNATSLIAQYTAATRALNLGRYAASLDMFEKLYKISDRDPRILLGLAVSQQGAGFTESAARTYEDLLKIDPMNEKAIVNLMGIMKSQYPAVTMQNLMQLRDQFPNNPGIPAQIGLANAEMKHYDEAARYLEIAASMDPRNPSHVYNMAIVADMKGDSKGAIRLYERALEMDATYGTSATALNREEIYDRLSVLRRKV